MVIIMKIINDEKKGVDSFGTGAYISKEYTVMLKDNTTIINGSVMGEDVDETRIINDARKQIVKEIIAQCAMIREAIGVVGDFEVSVYGSEKRVSTLDYYECEDTESQIIRGVLERYTDDLEDLYIQVKAVPEDIAEDFYCVCDEAYDNGISIVDFAENGGVING